MSITIADTANLASLMLRRDRANRDAGWLFACASHTKSRCKRAEIERNARERLDLALDLEAEIARRMADEEC